MQENRAAERAYKENRDSSLTTYMLYRRPGSTMWEVSLLTDQLKTNIRKFWLATWYVTKSKYINVNKLCFITSHKLFSTVVDLFTRLKKLWLWYGCSFRWLSVPWTMSDYFNTFNCYSVLTMATFHYGYKWWLASTKVWTAYQSK